MPAQTEADQPEPEGRSADSEAAPITAALAGIDLGDQALEGPQARASYGVSGAGIKIGILSDSYDVNGGAAAAISQGLLPASGVTVLQEGPPGSSDEGQAMAELVHATAPGAQLYFYSAYNSEQGFANGIAALAAAGCQVIVDDIVYVDEPFFQIAGPIDLAVQQAVANGVNYFSAAGNEGTSFFQGAFTPASTTIPDVGAAIAEQFPGGSFSETATIPAGLSVTLSLQWNAPYDAANPPTLAIVAVGANGSVTTSFQSNQEPTALLNFPVLNGNETYSIYVTQLAGTTAPSEFKQVLEGGGTLSGQGVGVGSGSIIGHDLVPGVNAVGAVNVADTPAEGVAPTPEPYTSTGPGELLLSANGTPLATPETLDTPAFLAPDGENTSVFAPFFGTSAAAAEAAAVAALVLQADPSLSNRNVTTLLDDSAIPAGAASVAGAGLINADAAVGYAATRVIAGSPQTTIRGIAQACTIVGSAGPHDLIAGAGATEIESEGTDTVVAGAGADTVDLLGAAALLFGGTGSLVVGALNGEDTVVAGPQSITVSGGTGGGYEWGSAAGHDRLTAGDAPTWLVAGGSGDTLVAAGGGNDSLLAGGSGAATMLGGAATAGSVFVVGGTGDHLILPGAGTNFVYLGGGADTVVGGSGRLVVQGGAGTPLVFGSSAGGNLLTAGSGAATLVGGGSGDLIQGAGAGDLLVAAAVGNDTLVGGSGNESLVGGTGGDNFFAAGGAAAVIAPEAAAAVVALGTGQSTVLAGSGTELVDVAAASVSGTDFVLGFNPAEDMLRLAGYGTAVETKAVAAQYDTGGNSWLSLPDGTVIAFVGLAHLNPANVVVV